jgi:erythromycin esterase-like protein
MHDVSSANSMRLADLLSTGRDHRRDHRRAPLGGLLSLGLHALVALAGAAPAVTAQDGPPTEAGFLAWATETAIPLTLDRDGAVDADVLAPLVEGKRFVFVGEPDHFITEKYDVRLMFLRALHGLGFRHLGMEMGRADGLRVDRYLETGDEDTLLEVGLYASARRLVDRRQPLPGFLAEELEYSRALRGLGEGDERLHYFGYDLDMLPGSGAEDVQARVAGTPAAAELLARLDDALDDDDPAEALARLLVEVRAPGSPFVTGVRDPHLLALDLFSLSESLWFHERFRDNPTLVTDWFVKREQAMFQIMDAQLEELGPDARIVLTGHNMHLGRTWKGARWSELDETAFTLWPTIGHHVTSRFPDEVLAVWMVYDHGEHNPHDAITRAVPVSSLPSSVEALLAQVPHEAFLLPLRSDDPRARWLDGQKTFRVNGGRAEGPLAQMADALCFVREVHALRAQAER